MVRSGISEGADREGDATGGEVRYVLEQVCDMLLELDGEGRIQYASLEWERFLGFQPTQLQQIGRLFHMEDRESMGELLEHCTEQLRTAKREYRLRGKDGEWKWLELQAVPVGSGENGPPEKIYLLHRDMTSRHQFEERLLTLAYHDSLTGLPNRRLFREHLNQALALSKRSGQLLGILYFDVNDFKRINDTMGHDTGDRFLQSFAARVRSSLREVDMLARMGGDEFAALLPNLVSAESLRTVTSRIERAVSAVWHVAGYAFKATASIGAAVFPNDGEEAVDLLRQADLKLYEVKHEYRSEELSS